MNEPIQHFLLIFDHEQGHLIGTEEFGTDGDAVLSAYAAKEREYRDRDRIEIVLVGSDSLETVRFTPANYFDGSVAVSKYLAGI